MTNKKTTSSSLHAHSPGPWHIGERNPEDNKLPIFACGERNPIAWVNPRPFFEDNQAANAALIAAAPETAAELERLRELREVLREFVLWKDSGIGSGNYDPLFDIAREVLAKTKPKD